MTRWIQNHRSCQVMSQQEELMDSVYRFIVTYIDENGFAPSQREIAEGCFISPATAARYLSKLEAKGWLQHESGRARGIVLLRDEN